MAPCDTDNFIYIKEPASGTCQFSIDSKTCVSFAFSQRIKIEVFLNSVSSSQCQTEENCVGGDQAGSNLGLHSNRNSLVVDGTPSHCNKKSNLEGENEISLISDDSSSCGITCLETLKTVNPQSKNNCGDEKLNQETENEISLISGDEISSRRVTCFETLDRANRENKNNTRKSIADKYIRLIPYIQTKANVSTKTKKSSKDSNVSKQIKIEKISLPHMSTNKQGSANTNIKLTSNVANVVIKKSHSKKHSNCQATCEVSCPYCLSVFPTRQDFYDHKKTVRVDSFQCKSCPKVFPFEAFLQAHTKTCHSEIGEISAKEPEGYKCDLCGNKNKTLFYFKKHLMFHTGEYFYNCCVCGKRFVELGTLKNHMSIHRSGGMVRCMCCNQLFATRGAMAKHKLALMKVRCHLCGETFTNKTSRTQHYKQFHQADILKCVKCIGLFSSQEELAAHMKNHKMCKKKQCTICGKLFSRLEKHVITHKPKSEIDENLLFVCDKCPRKFSNRSSFQRHLTIHSSDKPYQCPNCPRTYANCGQLRRHLKKHSTLMPYQCDVCGKKCKESGNLKVHMRIHSATKHFPCPLCPQAFNYKVSLDGHMKNRHPGNKASSDTVIGQSSDCPHAYDNTVAQRFTTRQACFPQHEAGEFISGAHSVTSLQHQFSKQPATEGKNFYESTGNPMPDYEGKKESYGLLSTHVFDVPSLQSFEGHEDHA